MCWADGDAFDGERHSNSKVTLRMPDMFAEGPVLMPQVAAPGQPQPLANRNILLLQGLMGPLVRSPYVVV